MPSCLIAELTGRRRPTDCDGDLTAALDRIQGVGQQIEKHLMEHLRVALHDGTLAPRRHRDLSVGQPRLPLHEGHGLPHHLQDVHGTEGGLTLPGEVEQPAHDRRRPRHLGLDHAEILAAVAVRPVAAALAGGDMPLQRLRKSRHGRQGVVQLVGHAGSQSAQRGQLLLPHEQVLGLLQLLVGVAKLLVEAGIFDGHGRLPGERDGKLLVLFAELFGPLLLREIQVAEHAPPRDDGHAEERPHCRMVRGEPVGAGIRGEIAEPQRPPLLHGDTQDPAARRQRPHARPLLRIQSGRHEAVQRPRRIQRPEGAITRLEEAAGDLHDPLEDGVQRTLRRQDLAGFHQGAQLFAPPSDGTLPLLQERHGHDRQDPVDDRLVHIPDACLHRRIPAASLAQRASADVPQDQQSPDDLLGADPAEDVPLGHVLGVRLRAVIAARLQAFDQRVIDPSGLGLRLFGREEPCKPTAGQLGHPSAADNLASGAQVIHNLSPDLFAGRGRVRCHSSCRLLCLTRTWPRHRFPEVWRLGNLAIRRLGRAGPPAPA